MRRARSASGSGPKRHVSSRRRERGQSLAETALILPLFMVLIVGVVEVTNAMNAYVTVVSSARDGARLGSKGLATDDEIKSLIVTETDRLKDPVDAAGDITVQHTTLSGDEALRVTVCNDYTPLLGVPLVMPDGFRMCSSTMMREFPGN